jgi:hypothetical protein
MNSPDMRPQRIKTTFHVIGTGLAMVCIVSAGFLFNRSGPRGPEYAASMLIVGAMLYALAVGIGRIVARFIGDKKSN